MNYGGDVKKGYFILFFQICNLFAEETSFSKLFSEFHSSNDSLQKVIEERIEQNIAKFRSVEASKVILPLRDIQSQESLWGVVDPRVVNVDVFLKLKKRKRLTLKEYRGISDLVSSSLAEKNQVIQVNIKDDEGFRWNEESEDCKPLFKATEIEQEIQSFLKDHLVNREIVWTQVNVSEKDFSCIVEGSHDSAKTSHLESRKELMNFLSDLCASSKIKILPRTLKAENQNKETFFIWAERASFLIVGFVLCAFALEMRKKKKKKINLSQNSESIEGAIVLTKIVERSPDEAAKWMVRTLMSEPEENKSQSRIIDDSL